ncbi:MAG: hypothetical protein ACYC67_01280 [Prosthecobacter sp.]
MKAQQHQGSFIVLFVASTVMASAALPGYPTDLDRRILSTIVVDPDKRDLTWLTPELRAQALDRLREALRYPSDHNWALAGLVALEDPETLSDLMRKYRTLPAEGPEREEALSMLEHYGDTSIVLPFLAKDLGNEQIYQKGSGDVAGDREWRSQAATEILDLIYMRNEFPQATKAWAVSLSRNSKKYLQVKQWWEHHKDLINARRYAEATWLPTTAEENKARDQTETNRILAGIDVHPRPQGQTNITPSLAEKHAAGTDKLPRTSILWPTLAVIIVMSALGFFLRFFKNK